ncbi:hypothetical protein FKW77_003508 [Venturia effusa]|uniref:Ubiquitin-like protease family profile domain-containing protein n=1 Tax=Venturia effusa TaxID=50376 RepID=A0A517KZ86_9PEZI|nr:hypothetical protein FKW77_003508 [Venturia effusa]
MTRIFHLNPTTRADKNTIAEPSDWNSGYEHCEDILDRLHFYESNQWVNPDDSDVANRIANMVLEVVPYFQNQANVDALRRARTTPDAYQNTVMHIGQSHKAEVTLDDLLTLVPSKGRAAWLTDRLMESLVQLIARPYIPGLIWFCSDGLLQTCMAALNHMNETGVDPFDFEQMLHTNRLDDILPGREIPPDARGIVFFHNPTKSHWITVFAHVDPTTRLGTIEIFNSAGNLGEEHSRQSLQFLLHCLSYKSPNRLFRRANWFANPVCSIACPQQSSENIDCGVFAVFSAINLLGREYPDVTERNDDEERRTHGLLLREHYMSELKEALDETDIAIWTIANRENYN